MTVGLTFRDNTLVVKAGQAVTLDVVNCSPFGHNFVSPSLKVSQVDLPKAATVADKTTIAFTAPTQPGKYMFWCSTVPQPGQPSHAERGMTGEVIVQ